jgi:hypothetical protein
MTFARNQSYVALAMVLGVGACSPAEDPALEASELAASDAGGEAGTPLREPCVMFHIYAIEAEQLTFQVGQDWRVERHWGGEFVNGLPVPGDWDGHEPILTGRLALHHRDGGRAELWFGERVLVTPIGPDYYTSKQTDIRRYESPTGVVAELHVMSRANCFTPPPQPLTRAEVDALEE